MRIRVGVEFRPQHTTIDALRAAWRAADDDEAIDSIWLWDHFYPVYGDPTGAHFECWTLLAAMAVETERAQFGALVTGNSYRNPQLLADMARTIDHLSAGRFVLGIGAGWREVEYVDYGYEFGTAGDRLRALEASLISIKERLARLNPPALDLPILIGGSGEKVTLRLVAEHARMWNSAGDPEAYARRSAVLDEWCAKVQRDPSEIERTIVFSDEPSEDTIEATVGAGATHLILAIDDPYDLTPVRRLSAVARRLESAVSDDES